MSRRVSKTDYWIVSHRDIAAAEHIYNCTETRELLESCSHWWPWRLLPYIDEIFVVICGTEDWGIAITTTPVPLMSKKLSLCFRKLLGHLQYSSHCNHWGSICGLWCQRQVSRAWINNYIPQNAVECNSLSIPRTPASGANVLIYVLWLCTMTRWLRRTHGQKCDFILFLCGLL